MRCFLLLIFLLIFSNSTIIAQHKTFQAHINVVEIDDLKNKIFESQKPYKIVFMFNQFCSVSRDIFPELDALYKNANQKNFELFVVSNTKEKNKEELQNHLFYYGYAEPFYIIKNKPLLGFYKKLIHTICESCDTRKMGYSDFIIFDKNNEVLTQTNHDIVNQLTKDERIVILKKYIQ